MFPLVDVDECASRPCKNGATCRGKVNGYECNCLAGYTATDCGIGKVELAIFW